VGCTIDLSHRELKVRQVEVIKELRAINASEAEFYRARARYGSFAEIEALRNGFAKLDAGRAQGHGYGLQINLYPDGYALTAHPISHEQGERSFYTDNTSVIRGRFGTDDANASDDNIDAGKRPN